MAIKICLDAGHFAKYNRSPVNKTYYESEMNWKLHNYLKAELESYGFKVIVTRTNQAKDLEVYQRGQKAKGCDLFLSIHSNASSYSSEDYAVVCCQVDDKTTAIDEKSVEIGKKLASIVNTTMSCKGKPKLYRRVGNYNKDYYGVLRGARAVNVPGVLLEHSFHTNLRATNWLLVDANLKKMAKAEAEVLAKHFGLKKAETKPKANTFKKYVVKVICEELNIRKTPKWTDNDIVGTVKKGEAFTIVAEKTVQGTKFGKLKSGAGYISLGSKYVKKV